MPQRHVVIRRPSARHHPTLRHKKHKSRITQAVAAHDESQPFASRAWCARLRLKVSRQQQLYPPPSTTHVSRGMVGGGGGQEEDIAIMTAWQFCAVAAPASYVQVRGCKMNLELLRWKGYQE